MAEIKTRETMWATMKPDVYGGATGDQIVPRWHVFADGDKQSEDIHDALDLPPGRFPPGTRIVIHEPACPQCDQTRFPIYPMPKTGPLFASKCDCGFDWDKWVLEEFS